MPQQGAGTFELERRFPNRFIPRYAMVSFHPEIPYAEALRRGEVQAQILLELELDSDRARRTLRTGRPADQRAAAGTRSSVTKVMS